MKYKYIIPDGLIKKITINGKEFIFTESRNQFQCAKCLYLYNTMAEPGENPNDSKVLYLEGECYCDQKNRVGDKEL